MSKKNLVIIFLCEKRGEDHVRGSCVTEYEEGDQGLREVGRERKSRNL